MTVGVKGDFSGSLTDTTKKLLRGNNKLVRKRRTSYKIQVQCKRDEIWTLVGKGVPRDRVKSPFVINLRFYTHDSYKGR